MGIPNDEYNNPETKDGWQHALTIPRELFLSENQKMLLQNPIKEMEALRREQILSSLQTNCLTEYKDLTIYELLLDSVSDDLSICIANHLHMNYSKEKTHDLQIQCNSCNQILFALNEISIQYKPQ